MYAVHSFMFVHSAGVCVSVSCVLCCECVLCDGGIYLEKVRCPGTMNTGITFMAVSRDAALIFTL